MTLVVDNCPPLSWAQFLQRRGHAAHHWRDLGPPDDPDTEIMRWARENHAVVLTQGLDFTKLLFQSGALLPSVIQLRIDDIAPQTLEKLWCGSCSRRLNNFGAAP